MHQCMTCTVACFGPFCGSFSSAPKACVPSSLHHVAQVGAKIVKAGPDNATVYMTGMGIMYKEHEILVEVNNDGSGIMRALHERQLNRAP